MAHRELTERALVEEMTRYLGARHTAALLGVATAAGLLGVHDRESFVNMPFGSIPSRYRWLHEFIDLRDHLVALGYDLTPEEEALPFRLPDLVVAGA